MTLQEIEDKEYTSCGKCYTYFPRLSGYTCPKCGTEICKKCKYETDNICFICKKAQYVANITNKVAELTGNFKPQEKKEKDDGLPDNLMYLSDER